MYFNTQFYDAEMKSLFTASPTIGLVNPDLDKKQILFIENESQSALNRGFLPNEFRTQDVILDRAYKILFSRFDENNYRFNLAVRWMPGSLRQVSPDKILNVEMLGEANRYTNFEVTFDDKNRRQIMQVQLSIDIEKKIPVANRRVMYGEILDTENLEYRWVSIPNTRGQLVSEMDKLIGKTIRRTLAIGQPIRHADITTDFLILAGDQVKLIFEEHGLRVELTAQASQDGAKDEVIKIYSENTRKRYMGKVISPEAVQWKKTL